MALPPPPIIIIGGGERAMCPTHHLGLVDGGMGA